MRITQSAGFAYLLIAFSGLSNAGQIQTSPLKPSQVDNTDNLIKRDLKLGDQSELKSLDPPPEFYRGPGSTYERDRTKDGNVLGLHRPNGVVVSSPSSSASHGYESRFGIKGHNLGGTGHGYYGPSSSSSSLLPPSSGDSGDYFGYHTNAPPSSGHSSHSSHSGQHIPYGHPQGIDFSKPTGHGQGHTGHGGLNGHGGQYQPPSSTGLDGFNEYERPIGGYGGQSTGYGGHPLINHNSNWDNSYPYYPGKTELAKSFLIPLAGVALLGLTAALISNPLLLQLGTIAGKRKRDLNGQIKSTEGQNLAYKNQKQN